MRDLFRRRKRPVETRRWTIRWPAGPVVAQLSRVEPGRNGRAKEYRWYGPDGRRRGLGGLRLDELPFYLTPGSGPIVVVEGPKAADAVQAAGYRAAASLTGAAATPGAQALEALRGEDVIFWPDFDQEGIRHMARIAAKVGTHVRTTRVIDPDPAWPAGTDAADLSIDEVRALIGGARTLRPMRSQEEECEGVLELGRGLPAPSCEPPPTTSFIRDDAPSFRYATPTHEELAPLVRAYADLQRRPVSTKQTGLLAGIYRVHGPAALTVLRALYKQRGSLRDLLKELRHLHPASTQEEN
jgi:hypothetical protein